MKRFFVIPFVLSACLLAYAGNPAGAGPSAGILPDGGGSDALSAYTSHSDWLVEAGTTVLINFEAFSSGTVITSELAPYGISAVSGLSGTGSAVDQIVLSSASIPFPMFTPGTLPSEPNFISNNMASPAYATGRITFVLAEDCTAIGAYVADGSPLDNFCIEVFDGASSLGSISVSPRTLPDSFIGVVSDSEFDSAVFYALSTTDSWGLDNLELNNSTSLEPGTWGSIKSVW